jgi:hypothetical protein
VWDVSEDELSDWKACGIVTPVCEGSLGTDCCHYFGVFLIVVVIKQLLKVVDWLAVSQ